MDLGAVMERLAWKKGSVSPRMYWPTARKPQDWWNLSKPGTCDQRRHRKWLCGKPFCGWLKPGASVTLLLSSLRGCHDPRSHHQTSCPAWDSPTSECNELFLFCLFVHFFLSLSSLFPQKLSSYCSFWHFRIHRFLDIIPFAYWLILVLRAYRQTENSQVLVNEKITWQTWLLVACLSIFKASLISSILIIIPLLGSSPFHNNRLKQIIFISLS